MTKEERIEKAKTIQDAMAKEYKANGAFSVEYGILAQEMLRIVNWFFAHGNIRELQAALGTEKE